MKHGTRATYQYHGCRCQPCRDANAAYSRHHSGGCGGYCKLCNKVLVLADFPVALVARQAFPDDTEAILAAFPVPIAVAGMGVDVQAPPPALHVDSGVTS